MVHIHRSMAQHTLCGLWLVKDKRKRTYHAHTTDERSLPLSSRKDATCPRCLGTLKKES